MDIIILVLLPLLPVSDEMLAKWHYLDERSALYTCQMPLCRRIVAMATRAATTVMRSTRLQRLLRFSSTVSSQPLRPLVHADRAVNPTSLQHGQSMWRKSLMPTGLSHQVRCMTSDLSALPEIKDINIRKALNALLGTSWLKVEPTIKSAVESALSSNSDDTVGKDALTDVWRSAQAIEQFGGILTEMLMEFNDLSGGSGETVNKLPDSVYNAVEAAHKKYCTYLDSFGQDEAYLKKKVENEIGSVLLQIKQRVSGMDPKWSKITLLGTSGLSGSYIERRGIVT